MKPMKAASMNMPALPCDSDLDILDELPLPYLEIDAHGIIARANRAALDLQPPEQGELVGQTAFSLLAGGERELGLHAFAALMESGEEEPLIVVRHIYDRSGKFSAYQIYRSVMRDRAGNPTGLRIVGVNVSEMTEALEDAQRRSQWLESIVDSMHEAIIATDATGVIASVNSAAEELLGWKAEELVGKSFEEGIHMRSFEAGDKTQVTFTMVLTNRCDGLSTLVDRSGHEITVRVWSSPVIDKKNGSVTGIVLLMYKPGTPMIVKG